MTLNDLIRQRVRKRANYYCEYCHSPEQISASRFTIDHIQPRSLGGSDQLDNLALACRRCNQRRYNFTVGSDQTTNSITPIFNPRTQQWSDHFIWSKDTINIIGTTPTGRATCQRLDLNDERYPGDRNIRETRQIWHQAGWHPPKQDPIQKD